MYTSRITAIAKGELQHRVVSIFNDGEYNAWTVRAGAMHIINICVPLIMFFF